MRCLKCRFENPEGTLYCGKCGTRFAPAEDSSVSPTMTLHTPSKELARGSVFAGRFEVIESLGRGGMGTVYRVMDKKISEEIALKLLKPEVAADINTIERFKNELKLARKITHKNVCRMYDLNEEEGTLYITMEYVSGEDLKSLVRRAGQLSVGKAISIAKQVCEGLAEAHRLAVVHRDLKPQNIMIDREGNVHIMDFGIARSLRAPEFTEAGMIIGTPDYMSPEQVAGEATDQRSDIYSLGVILYEMVTGRVPFEGDTSLSVALKHKTEIQTDPCEFNAQMPQALSRLILKCMEKAKELRFQNAEDLLAELANIEAEVAPEKKIKAERKSIAVLPFKDLSPQRDQDYFCDGLAEELINALTQVKDLRVAARTSSFSFKGKDVDIREIGKKLNVGTMLEGSVQKAGNRLRITAQLINIAGGYHLWSQRFDRDMEDIFAIQDEISMAIVDKLRIEILESEKEKIIKRHTQDKEAYNLYLKGRFFWNRRHEGDMLRAIQLYQQALAKDPHYALPYVGIADVFNVFGLWSFIPPKEAYSKAKAALLKALEIDDTLGDAYTSLAFITALYEWDWPTAEKYFKRGIELNPNNSYAHGWYAITLSGKDRFEEALSYAKRAFELEPLSPLMNALYGVALGIAGKHDEGIEQLHKALEMEPNLPMGHLFLGMVSLFPERYLEEAIDHLQKAFNLGVNFALGWLGLAYAKAGKRDEALKILCQLEEISKEKYIAPVLKALVYFGLGMLDKAFEQLEQSYLARDYYLYFLKVPRLFTLAQKAYEDPRYKVLAEKIGPQ
jgi:serine/threonine protein kinase